MLVHLLLRYVQTKYYVGAIPRRIESGSNAQSNINVSFVHLAVVSELFDGIFSDMLTDK